VSIAPLLLAVACTSPGEPVPEDLEGLLHYLWAERLEGDDEDLATAVANLDAVVGGSTLATPLTGRTEALTDEELATADLDREVDPSEAVGMTLVNPFACELDVAAELLVTADQDDFYDTFEDYERRHLDDVDAWLDGELATIAWEVTYAVSIPLGSDYTADLAGGARRVGVDVERGDFVLSWGVLTEPATFDNDEDVFDQDYRIELFYAPVAGTVVHAEALWRHMEAGFVDTDDDVMQDLILDGILDWDATTAEWCETGWR